MLKQESKLSPKFTYTYQSGTVLIINNIKIIIDQIKIIFFKWTALYHPCIYADWRTFTCTVINAETVWFGNVTADVRAVATQSTDLVMKFINPAQTSRNTHSTEPRTWTTLSQHMYKWLLTRKRKYCKQVKSALGQSVRGQKRAIQDLCCTSNTIALWCVALISGVNQSNESSFIHTTFDTNVEGFTRAWKRPYTRKVSVVYGRTQTCPIGVQVPLVCRAGVSCRLLPLRSEAKGNLYVAKIKRMGFGVHAFSVAGSKCWNSIPPLIHTAPSNQVIQVPPKWPA